jgi:hypothetical protein
MQNLTPHPPPLYSFCKSDVYFIILLGLFLILFYKIYKLENIKEGFAASDDIKAAIGEVYNADIEAIRNLSSIAKKLQVDGLTIPGKLNLPNNTSLVADGDDASKWLRVKKTDTNEYKSLAAQDLWCGLGVLTSGSINNTGALTTGSINNTGALTTGSIINAGALTTGSNIILSTTSTSWTFPSMLGSQYLKGLSEQINLTTGVITNVLSYTFTQVGVYNIQGQFCCLYGNNSGNNIFSCSLSTTSASIDHICHNAYLLPANAVFNLHSQLNRIIQITNTSTTIYMTVVASSFTLAPAMASGINALIITRIA